MLDGRALRAEDEDDDDDDDEDEKNFAMVAEGGGGIELGLTAGRARRCGSIIIVIRDLMADKKPGVLRRWVRNRVAGAVDGWMDFVRLLTVAKPCRARWINNTTIALCCEMCIQAS